MLRGTLNEVDLFLHHLHIPTLNLGNKKIKKKTISKIESKTKDWASF